MPPLPADRFRRLRRRRIARALLLSIGSGGVLLLLAALRVHAVARLASCRAPGARAIVVPGYRLEGSEVPAAYAARLCRAWQLWRRDPARTLVLSGAPASPDAASEAHGGLAFLCDLGLPGEATVLLDPEARDSEENLQHAAALLAAHAAPDNPAAPRPVAIVSNRWHLARCAWLAERQALPWRVCAAERRWRPGLFAWLALWREAFSLLSFAGADAIRLDPHRLTGNSR